MVDIAVEKPVCGKCGAEVRDESLFCYSCGEAVSAVPSEIEAEQILESSDATPALPAPDKTNAENGTGRAAKGKPAFEKAKLQTAASLRKRPKSFERKQVEVVWEPRTEPGASFIIAVVGLTLTALFLLVAAMYLR